MSQRRLFVTMTLNLEKARLLLKQLRNIKSKHKYFILGTNNIYMNVKYNIKLDHLSRDVEL